MAENKVNVDSQWVKENTAARGREWMGKQPENTQTALCRREQRDVWGNRAKARARVLNMGGIGGDRRVGGALARGSGHLKKPMESKRIPVGCKDGSDEGEKEFIYIIHVSITFDVHLGVKLLSALWKLNL